MTLKRWVEASPWGRYSKKIGQRLEILRNIGQIHVEEALARDLRFVSGKSGQAKDGNTLLFYWLVDRDDGVIVDCKFQAFGQTALLAAADAACELIVGKNYDQARRLGTDLIDRQVRDKPDIPAFPKEAFLHLNLVIDAIDDAAEQCLDLPLPHAYTSMPAPQAPLEGEGYPGWDLLTLKEQLAVVESILDQDIRPYIALDEGGVEIINLIQGKELVIAYQGNCTSCYASIGSTLSYIQQVMRARIHADFTVTPNL